MIVIPDHLRAAQLKASDPAQSIWVSANAGSGKTHVLTQRVIRLLLRGVPPAKILCLTFTKAAAAQMATRVFETLARWTSLDDEALRRAVMETGAPAPTSVEMLLARRLFTRAVETPGGLKIQTIHAFCERLLHLFPFEANVPARFEVTDDTRQATLLAGAKRDAIAQAHHAKGPLGAALSRLADEVTSSGIDGLVGEAMALRKPALRWTHADPQGALPRLLGLSDGRDDEARHGVEAIERSMIEGGIGPEQWRGLSAVFATGSPADIARAAKLGVALEALAAGTVAGFQQAVDAYLSVFLNDNGKPAVRLMTKGLASRHPDIAEAMAAEQTRLIELVERRKIAETLDRTRDLLALADAVLLTYEQRKILNGVLDFDDLIERTRALLARSDASWVLHKLDSGIDHVLVDEAQDTSEAQWRILDDLTGEFASGFGAGAPDRSFFAVGDDKQSIFSFQGAAPHKFHEMRRSFARRFEQGAKPFDHVRLQSSFRSVPGILSAVDTVFQVLAHQGGLVPAGETWPVHDSIKARLPGLVEIWPPVTRGEDADPGDWRIPVDMADDRDPAAILAGRIAKTIASLIAPGSTDRVHDGRGARTRPIRPGDVLILVRRRNVFFEAIIRALKQAHVPVAGADRLDITNHIAVMDLVAAGRAALLPSDDLTLACLLKSPLFGLTDDDLMRLAPDRDGSLIAALARAEAPGYRAAAARVMAWGKHAADATPFAFYAELLGRDGGRRQIEARLGAEAHDAIDEFLRLALAHERDAAPSLGGFLDEIEALRTSIKRDMESGGDAVRVMTVHAAKGLEAKIVFLPDTCGVPSPRHEPTIFNLEPDDTRPPVLAWSPRKEDDCPAVALARVAARDATMAEYRRLLYVALTRAEERLYIAGYHGTKQPDGQCWSKMIEAAFADDPSVQRLAAPWDAAETVVRLVAAGADHRDHDEIATPSIAARQETPDWLFRDAPRGPGVPSPLRPSPVEPVATTHAGEGPSGLAFGAAIHALLHYLPEVACGLRAASARAFLADRHDLSAASVEVVIAQALAVLASPALAPLFAPGSRGEVPLLGAVTRADGSTLTVRGTVDRIAVTAETVWLADYKSGHPSSDTPAAYVRQLALYRLVLAPLWPGRAVRALLVWTTGPTRVEIDAARLDAAAADAVATP